jgi:hypothetical protein
MTETATAPEPELTAEQKAEIKKVQTLTKRGFDPKARLQNRGLRRATITLFLDEEKGVELGWAREIYNEFNQPVGMEHEGVLGELDLAVRLRENRIAEHEKALQEHAEAANAGKVTGTRAKAAPKLDNADIDERIAELEAKRDELVKELERTGLTIKLRAVPPIIEKGTRRQAKVTLGINEKNIPDDKKEEFNIAAMAHLMAVMFQSVTDNESGEVNEETTYDDAIALMDYLPPGQWHRLDNQIGKVQFTDAISRVIESQEDFS